MSQVVRKQKEEVFEAWVVKIAARLRRQVRRNTGAKVLAEKHVFGAFVSSVVPGISLEGYINASYKAAVYCKLPCSVQCWEAALILMERLPCNVVTEYTVHRLLLTAYLVGMKTCSDRIISNKVVALYGGITMHELNKLERHFLVAMDFNVNVTKSQHSRLWTFSV